MRKKCSVCEIEKDIECFGVLKKRKDGRRSICKECRNNKEKCYSQVYKEKNKETIKQRNKLYNEKNKDKIRLNGRKYRENNRDIILEKNRIYKNNNREKILADKKLYYKKNKEKHLEYGKKYERNKRKNDPIWKLTKHISLSVRMGLKKQGVLKTDPTWSKLPYTPQQLKEHLEKQFEPWMNWNNYGKASIEIRTWNIDHIVPQSKLLYSSMEEENFQKCWSLENLRPLDAMENIKKGNIIINEENIG